MHLNHIDIIAIPVGDQDASRDFYRDVLVLQEAPAGGYDG